MDFCEDCGTAFGSDVMHMRPGRAGGEFALCTSCAAQEAIDGHDVAYTVSMLVQPNYPGLEGSYVPTTARCSCGAAGHGRSHEDAAGMIVHA